ncbi:MAG: serine hydrolase [Candidatus Cloacimonetes bacterium]|nr:serine hydrolase [Candidatus Cloacimonadota bacterium]
MKRFKLFTILILIGLTMNLNIGVLHAKDKADKKSKAFMGVFSEDISEETAQRLKLKNDKGLLITGVGENSPAFKQGLKADDVIIRINDTEITVKDDFTKIMAGFFEGDQINLTYVREGKSVTIPFVFGSKPIPEKPGKFALKEAQQKQINQLLTLINDHQKTMGSLAVAKKGKVLYTQSIGYKNRTENNQQVADENTKFRIGSISKMFTSVMIYQLIEEGKLSLDTKLKEFYPMIPHAEKITIQMMLTHQSGIYSVTDAPDYLDWCQQYRGHDFLIEKMLTQQAVFLPGEKMEYSNSNYILLGYIIEKLDKCDYAQSLKNRIVQKINLRNTFYGGKINTDYNEALSYRFVKNWEPAIETDMSIPGGAGAIISTPSDLVQFIDALFNKKLISKKSLRQMMVFRDGMGSGMIQFDTGNQMFYGHTGGIDGFSSILVYNPKDRVSLSFVSNGAVYPASNITFTVTDIVYGKKVEMPKFREEIQLKDLNIYAGTFQNDEIKMDIAVTVNDNVLYAQASGQGKFPLSAFDKHKFQFEPAGIVVEFSDDSQQFILFQGKQQLVFKRLK